MARDAPHEHEPIAPPARLWTVEEANGRLEELRELLPRLRAWVVRLRKIHEERQRLTEFWGKEIDAPDLPDGTLVLQLNEEWTNLSHRLEAEVQRLQSEGIELKDLESGLVDFYSLRGAEVILLCWQYGEEEVAFYHTLEGGYRNRRPLPERSGRTPPPTSHRASP
jgi:hypothetical protein